MDNKCKKCNKNLFPDSNTTNTSQFDLCDCPVETNLTGWICPVCGAGCSPFTSQCPCTMKQLNWFISVH